MHAEVTVPSPLHRENIFGGEGEVREKGGRGFSTTVEGSLVSTAAREIRGTQGFSGGDPEGAPPQDNGPIRTHRTFYPPFHHHR